MTNIYLNYYKVVEENANNMVGDMYNDLIDELKEEMYNYSYETWERLNERFIQEFDSDIEFDLREAVEVVEQSKRKEIDCSIINKEQNAKEQLKSIAYWVYQNDLIAEFKIALLEHLSNEIILKNKELEKIENVIKYYQNEIEDREKSLIDLENDLQVAFETESEFRIDERKDEIIQKEQLIERTKKHLENTEKEYNQIEILIANIADFIVTI